MRAAGETVVRSLDVFVAYGEPFDMARYLDGFRYLRIFQGKGDVVGHDFPPLASVIGDGVGIEIGDILLRLAHLLQRKPYQVVHQAHAGEFGVGAHSRHAAHSEDAAVNVHFARIDTYLRHEFVVVGEPAEYVGFLQLTGFIFRLSFILFSCICVGFVPCKFIENCRALERNVAAVRIRT